MLLLHVIITDSDHLKLGFCNSYTNVMQHSDHLLMRGK